MIEYLKILNLIKKKQKKYKFLKINLKKKYLNFLNLLILLNLIKLFYIENNKIIIFLHQNINKKIIILFKPSSKLRVNFNFFKKCFNKQFNKKIILFNKNLFFTHSTAIKKKIDGFLFFLVY